jgi:hypothetical protein
MGNIQELESENSQLREEIEKAYGQIGSLNKILREYILKENGFISTKLREKSLLEKILPTNETSTRN